MAAQQAGIALGLGSLRVALEHPGARRHLPGARSWRRTSLLLANLGAVQLNYGYGVDECRRAMEMVGADALVLHLNPMQEALQGGGNTNFSPGSSRRSRRLPRKMPVVLKEVGFGLSEEVARWAAGPGSWPWTWPARAAPVEPGGGPFRGRRRRPKRMAGAFAEWGIPTAESLRAARRAAPGLALIASGGVRSGLDMAKAIALGANLAGWRCPSCGPPWSPDAVRSSSPDMAEELRMAMFGAGAGRPGRPVPARRVDGERLGKPWVPMATRRSSCPASFLPRSTTPASHGW